MFDTWEIKIPLPYKSKTRALHVCAYVCRRPTRSKKFRRDFGRDSHVTCKNIFRKSEDITHGLTRENKLLKRQSASFIAPIDSALRLRAQLWFDVKHALRYVTLCRPRDCTPHVRRSFSLCYAACPVNVPCYDSPTLYSRNKDSVCRIGGTLGHRPGFSLLFSFSFIVRLQEVAYNLERGTRECRARRQRRRDDDLREKTLRERTPRFRRNRFVRDSDPESSPLSLDEWRMNGGNFLRRSSQFFPSKRKHSNEM